ncbi:restriction endonuclease subunit S [Enterococcus faecium]|uniref:restriction endonuclease subunit S n=1 Tax=Enterococcus faecium TaxID=1352 RepID=UPI001040DD09|nr:restriction endonuclease subunit S [Enterococcus faecium]MCO5419689.1 restriction endonuclease subunit S [Enterococcus faecium]NTR34762.1 restriction endonuclease subunit S [Enterococcus faecium]
MSNDKQPEIRFPGFTEAWEQRKLDDVVEFYSGLTYSPDNVQEDGTFVLRSSNVKNGEIIDADNVYVSHEVVNSGNVQEGDVIVVVRNGSRDLIGKHAQIKRQMDNTVIGAFMTGVRSETPDFTNAMLDTQQFAVEINKNLGATINQITTGAFKKMQFVVPKDRDEREAIGTFFRSIDDTITLHQRKLDLLKETKKGFLQKMFPKNGAKVPEIRFSGFTEDWEQRKLGEIVQITMGQSPNSENYTENPEDYILVQGNADMKNNRVVPRVWTTQITKQAEKGDLILSVRAPVGDIGKTDYDVVLGRGVAAIKGNDFIFQQLGKMKESGYWNRFSTGSTFESINSNDIREALITIPTGEEQQKIGTFFQQLDDTIALHQRKLDLLKETKKGFLQKMFV